MQPLIALLGPTASGKTKLAVALAQQIGAEIVSADSRQLYQGMDIGTGKDLSEYAPPDGPPIPFHLIDIAPAGERLSLFNYAQACHKALADINARGAQALLCGGSGLYAEAIIRGYKLPEAPPNPALRNELAALPTNVLIARLATHGPLHNHTDTDSRARLIRAIEIAETNTPAPLHTPPARPIGPVMALNPPRAARRARIAQRLTQRLHNGLIEEVQTLIQSGVPTETMEYYGLEYRYIARYLNGTLTREELVRDLGTAICQFAKRQMTYLRGMERRGVPIRWIEWHEEPNRMLAEMLNIVTATGIHKS